MNDPAPVRVAEPNPDDGFELTQQAWNALLGERDALNIPELEIQLLQDFIDDAEKQPLSSGEKEIILNSAAFLIQNMYPHLPFKQRLFKFARPLEALEEARQATTEADFHAAAIVGISNLVDAHTLYGLPQPYRGAAAFLPFELKVYRDRDRLPHFVVTRMMKTRDTFPFSVGAEITRWGDVSADAYIENSQGRIPGGNAFSRIARGTLLATIRPLRFCQPPQERIANIQYIPAGGGEPAEIGLRWGVATWLNDTAGSSRDAFSINVLTECARAMNSMLVRRQEIRPELNPHASAPPSPMQVSELPEVFAFQYTRGIARLGLPHPDRLRSAAMPNARFGYIRIKQFARAKTLPEAFVAEFRRILEQVMNQEAPDGLSIDIRGNPGGAIGVAESLLQMLTDAAIVPVNFHVANTPVLQDFLRSLKKRDSGLKGDAIVRAIQVAKDLKPWIDDVENFDPNSLLSPGHPLTDPQAANAIGQIYRGKCALLVDALSYSSADIFAAGFQDHNIGPVIGTDRNTGGGGANVWTQDDIALHLADHPQFPDVTLLPREATLSLAIRRCTRVGNQAGIPIEDLGVTADLYFAAGSGEERINGSQSVVQFACDHLTKPRKCGIAIRRAIRVDDRIEIEIETSNLDFVLPYIDDFAQPSTDVSGGGVTVLRVPVPKNVPNPSRVRVEGNYLYPPDIGPNFITGAIAVADLTP